MFSTSLRLLNNLIDYLTITIYHLQNIASTDRDGSEKFVCIWIAGTHNMMKPYEIKSLEIVVPWIYEWVVPRN